MPQIYLQTLSPNTQMVVWHITEPESFFLEKVSAGKEIAHPHKRLQHLCGRYLLHYLVPEFPMEKVVAEHNNKPFLPGHPYHFSISHCDDFATAIVSNRQQVGIDIESIEERVVRIRKKFLTENEEQMLVASAGRLGEKERLTLAWSAKEAMFKWLGEAGVDFKQNMVLETLDENETGGVIVADLRRTTSRKVQIGYRFLKGLVLTWIET